MNVIVGYLGVDVGSVSTNIVIIDEAGEVIEKLYLRTNGKPIEAVTEGLNEIKKMLNSTPLKIKGVGTTGSARELSAIVVGADIVKNEITAHAIAAKHVIPDVRTVLEIGGQDSKIIFLDPDGTVKDFEMNTVCAAGTGAFLDHQSGRLGIPIEQFGEKALCSSEECTIAGRCSVFAESDMIHKQQVGKKTDDIIYGLCQALVRNYLTNLAKGKDIISPIIFQGGVAANQGMKKAFEEALGEKIIIPKYFDVMGAIGAALLAKEEMENNPRETLFRGFDITQIKYETKSFNCGKNASDSCGNNCEITRIIVNSKTVARWGGRCDKWEMDPSIRLEKIRPHGELQQKTIGQKNREKIYTI